jgi:hypothetical protein
MKYKLLSPLAGDVFKGIFADRRNIDNLAAFLRPIVHLPGEELNPNSAQVRLSISNFSNNFLILWAISFRFHLPYILTWYIDFASTR